MREVHGVNTPERVAEIEAVVEPIFDCLEGIIEQSSRLIYEAGREDERSRIRQELVEELAKEGGPDISKPVLAVIIHRVLPVKS